MFRFRWQIGVRVKGKFNWLKIKKQQKKSLDEEKKTRPLNAYLGFGHGLIDGRAACAHTCRVHCQSINICMAWTAIHRTLLSFDILYTPLECSIKLRAFAIATKTQFVKRTEVKIEEKNI